MLTLPIILDKGAVLEKIQKDRTMSFDRNKCPPKIVTNDGIEHINDITLTHTRDPSYFLLPHTSFLRLLTYHYLHFILLVLSSIFSL